MILYAKCWDEGMIFSHIHILLKLESFPVPLSNRLTRNQTWLHKSHSLYQPKSVFFGSFTDELHVMEIKGKYSKHTIIVF